jgi:hypothetical protein
LKTTVSKSPTPHQSALFLVVGQANSDSVYWALNALGCYWEKEETRPLNPEEHPSKNMAKSWFSNRQLAVGSRTALTHGFYRSQ